MIAFDTKEYASGIAFPKGGPFAKQIRKEDKSIGTGGCVGNGFQECFIIAGIIQFCLQKILRVPFQYHATVVAGSSADKCFIVQTIVERHGAEIIDRFGACHAHGSAGTNSERSNSWSGSKAAKI